MDETKGGRRGSGNLASAIGLYKSGQDLTKLVCFRRLTMQLKKRESGSSLQEAVSPGLLSPVTGNKGLLSLSLARSMSMSPLSTKSQKDNDFDLTVKLKNRQPSKKELISPTLLLGMSPTPIVDEEVKESSSSSDNSLER